MATAIEFDHVGKQYRLGLVSMGTLGNDLKRWWTTSILRKEDPFLKVGEVNDRSVKGESEYVWALKDIDFKVEQGDVVGIIGRNGAGKSTLLKLLSRVTGPTVGEIRARGRIGSLLEVGTGFHPEMTGRENIYLNGTILGMTKSEVDRKLDEIIDFSGCERYIDTPVKRYSSGMMVRLGFAVAAHLDPEILVVDEVLAVGDAEFQKKAIGKMQDVSKGEGRTVLFVSHNMAAVKNLCKRGVVLDKGRVVCDDTVENAIDYYIGDSSIGNADDVIISSVSLKSSLVNVDSVLFNGSESRIANIPSNQKEISISVKGESQSKLKVDLSIMVRSLDGTPLASLSEGHFTGENQVVEAGRFYIEKRIVLPKYLFSGDCYIDIALHQPGVCMYFDAQRAVKVHFEGNMGQYGHALDMKYNGFMGFETISGK